MLLIALVVGVICGALTTGLGFIRMRGTEGWVPQVVGGVAVFILDTFITWACLYWGQVPLVGIDLWWLAFINVFVVAIIAGIVAGFQEGWNLAAALAAVTSLVLLIGGFGQAAWWYGSDNARQLASLASVRMMPTSESDPLQGYPDTDDAHMVVVGDQAALFIAHQAMNTQNIGSLYNLGTGELQSIAGHMYYVYDLRPNGWRNSRKAQYTVPGYVYVDAEDPTAPVQTKLDYQMHWWPDGWYQGNLERYVWSHGYNRIYVDNLTLEIDDSWRPYYTASINETPLRTADSVPVGFITVDPQTGEITRYGLDEIPSWVDRVYSKGTATAMLNWWGMWGQNVYESWPMFGKSGDANRFQVDGDVNLVYTKNGPAWQAMMRARNGSNSAQYIALFDTRRNDVRMYTAPKGLVLEESVKSSFTSSGININKLTPTSLALHKIYGQLTWVGSLIGSGSDSFQGVGMLSATSTDGANVVIAPTKSQALQGFATWLANVSSNPTPSAEGSLNQKTTGVIAAINFVNSGGNTYVELRLVGDDAHIYLGKINVDSLDSLQMGFLKPGDQVEITYADLGKPVRQVSAIRITG